MSDRRRCAVTLEPSSPVRDPRRRILDAFVQVVARAGYGRTSIADVLRLANVAEPVFYEHFEDTCDCMIAALDERIGWIGEVLSEHVDEAPSWPERVHRGLRALLEELAEDPDGARLVLVECLAAGEPAIARLHAAMASCAYVLEQGREQSPAASDVEYLPPQISQAIAGGIASILHRRALERRIDELPGLLPDLLFFALMPYLGHKRALAISRHIPRVGTDSSVR